MLYLSTCVGFGYGLSMGYFLELIHCIQNPLISYNFLNSSLPCRCRNINLLPIDYASQPRLRGRLTLRRLALRRKPWTFSGSVSHTSFRYSCQHSHFWYLHHALQHSFSGLQNAPLPITSIQRNSATSVYGFSPVTSSAQIVLLRSVSYYAFFKGWLLLSQPPDCFGQFTSFTT